MGPTSEAPPRPALSVIAAGSRAGLGSFGARARDGVITTGKIVVLGIEASVAAVTDIAAWPGGQGASG